MNEPEYYVGDGLSPIGAFKQGLISEEEYRGFLKGNIIKYVVRAGKKDDAVEDLKKAGTYIDFYLELLDTINVGEIPVTVELNDETFEEYGGFDRWIEKQVSRSMMEFKNME